MRFFVLFVSFFLVLGSFSAPAHAGFMDFWNDLTCWIFPCTGNGSEYYTRPYLEDGKTPHNIQWADDDWKPQDWIDEKHSAQDVMSGFYKAGIITDQGRSWKNGSPQIEVGQRFMRLSRQEKSRVIRFVDEVGGYSKGATDGTVFIYHKASGDQIGIYNAEGLQLQ